MWDLLERQEALSRSRPGGVFHRRSEVASCSGLYRTDVSGTEYLNRASTRHSVTRVPVRTPETKVLARLASFTYVFILFFFHHLPALAEVSSA
jgi:hypothetical protein